jgi:phosphatidate cytidylyltransferase
MKRILTAVVLVPLVLLLVFKGPYGLVTLAVAAVAELALWEYLGLADATGAKTPRIAVMVALAAQFAGIYFLPLDWIGPVLVCLALALFIVCAFRSPLARVLPDTAYSAFGLIYVGFAMATLLLLWSQENGKSLLLFLFLAVWSGDIAALYIGKALGRRKLAPSISPNKTWEGAIASVVGSVLITVLLLWLAQTLTQHDLDVLFYPGAAWRWIGLAALLNVAAQVGDLVESAIKRGAGVKDSGTLLPGHGGVLDRIDALLLAAPVLWYAMLLQQAF